MAREIGWHAHPWRSVWRYWDGQQWTEEQEAKPKAATPPATAAPAAPTAAGWYPDPQMAGTRRYWDGNAWTDHVAPAEQPHHGPLTQARVIALGILIAVAVLFVIYRIAHANDGLNCSVDNADRASQGQPLLDCPERPPNWTHNAPAVHTRRAPMHNA